MFWKPWTSSSTSLPGFLGEGLDTSYKNDFLSIFIRSNFTPPSTLYVRLIYFAAQSFRLSHVPCSCMALKSSLNPFFVCQSQYWHFILSNLLFLHLFGCVFQVILAESLVSLEKGQARCSADDDEILSHMQNMYCQP